VKIYKEKTGIYYVSFLSSEGKRKRKSLETKSLKDARELCKQAKIEELEMAARAGALQRDAIAMIVAGKKIKLSDLIEEWKKYKTNMAQSVNTIYTQESLIRAFIEFSKVSYLDGVTKEMVANYINQDTKAKAGSREQRHSAIRSLYQYAIAMGYTITNPTKLVAIDKSKLSHQQKEKKPRQPITQEEYNTIIAHSGYFFMEATALAWWTGLRLSDIARLEWESINLDDKTLIIHTKKTDTRICIPLDDPLVGNGAVLKMLKNLSKDKLDEKFVFPAQNEIDRDVSRRATLSVYYGRMLARLKIKGKSFHCLRHSFVSRCRKHGKSLEQIALWVGHSSEETTKIYDHQGPRV